MLIGVWKSPIGKQPLASDGNYCNIYSSYILSSIFRASMPSKVYYAILRIQNGVLVQFSTSWTIALNPLGAHNNNAKILYMYLNNAMQVIQRRTPHFAGCSLKNICS